MKISLIIRLEKAGKSGEDEFYKYIREFIYEDSKYFEDNWLKMLIKG